MGDIISIVPGVYEPIYNSNHRFLTEKTHLWRRRNGLVHEIEVSKQNDRTGSKLETNQFSCFLDIPRSQDSWHGIDHLKFDINKYG